MKISIIVPTYNSALTLRDTLSSILRQTYKDYEVWIIDGASCDATMDIVHEFEPAFEGRLQYVSERDKGIYDAMNKGIHRATGSIVGILNSDDFYTSDNALETIADAFRSDDKLELTYGDVHYVNDGELQVSVRYYSSRIFRPSLLRWGYMPAHPSCYVLKSVYDDIGDYSLNYKIASDFDMMVRLFHSRGVRYRYIPKDFVTMRTGGISTSSISHRLLITHEDARACRSNGLFSCFPMCCVKYFTKIFEFTGLMC